MNTSQATCVSFNPDDASPLHETDQTCPDHCVRLEPRTRAIGWLPVPVGRSSHHTVWICRAGLRRGSDSTLTGGRSTRGSRWNSNAPRVCSGDSELVEQRGLHIAVLPVRAASGPAASHCTRAVSQ